jgi:3-deoxy-D-manno-octulosonic-acid transferase
VGEEGRVTGGGVGALDVVEEVAGDGGVGGDGGGLEAEVVVVEGDVFVDVFFADGDGDGEAEGEAGAGGGLHGEEAALEIFGGGGGDGVVVGVDEDDAGVVEGDGELGVVGDDDADGEHVVVEVFEAEGWGVFGVAGLGGDGDVLEGVGVVQGVLRGGEWLESFAGFFGWGGEGEGGEKKDAEEGAAGGDGHGSIILWEVMQGNEGGFGRDRDDVVMGLYSAVLAVGLVLSAPWWLLRMVTTERYREGLGARLGRVPRALLGVVTGKRVVWVHAVSVGEVLAATRLVSELEAALVSATGVGWVVVVSTTTRTGQALAKERFGAGRVFYYPLDFAWAVRAYLRVLRPSAVVLMESEVWPRMLWECRNAGVPVVVANARVSDRSFARGMKVKAVWGRVLRGVGLWLAQSEEDGRRLVAMGASAEAVKVVGNLKYDVRAAKGSRVAELIKEVAGGRPIVVAGSTVASTEKRVDCEEAQVTEGWMKGALPYDALLVVAPRHPERFDEVWQIVFDFPSLRATDLLAGKRRGDAVARTYPDYRSFETMDIVLLDTIGDLAAVYGIADVAYVGGSMMNRGGHNPLEPAQFGVPVVIGTSYENFRDVVGRMIAADGIRVVKDEVELERVFEALLTDREAARAMGERGKRVFEEQQGATGRAVETIVGLIVEGVKA